MDIDKGVVGLKSNEIVVEVEKGHIRRFADAIGDLNPLFRDPETAAKTPYGGIIAPPTFPIALTQGLELPLKLDYRRMLHGGQEFIYYRVIRPGDKLYCQSEVVGLYEKEGRSGSMQFLIIDTKIKDEAGNLCVISRNTIVYRKLS